MPTVRTSDFRVRWRNIAGILAAVQQAGLRAPGLTRSDQPGWSPPGPAGGWPGHGKIQAHAAVCPALGARLRMLSCPLVPRPPRPALRTARLGWLIAAWLIGSWPALAAPPADPPP